MEQQNNTVKTAFDNINWNYLLESIEDEKCILCIGPGIYENAGDMPFDKKLAEFLSQNEKELRIRVYDDGWFHYLPDASEIDAWKKVKEFYNLPNPAGEAILDKLAGLPFHFIITFNPDYKIREAFNRQGFGFRADSYLKKMPYDESALKPTRNIPLIYNLLGEVNKRNSLVMTYNDLYAYLESAFEGNSMPPVLKENIWDADYFIFLGVPFDKWYIHLFMRILQQHDRKRTSKKYAANTVFDDAIATSCSEQYTMTFVPQQIDEFVHVLFEKCQERQLTREPWMHEKIQIEISSLKNLLVESAFDKLFTQLYLLLKPLGQDGAQFINNTLMLESQVSEIRQKTIRGTISMEEERLMTAQAREHIFIFLLQLEKHFLSSEKI